MKEKLIDVEKVNTSDLMNHIRNPTKESELRNIDCLKREERIKLYYTESRRTEPIMD